MSKPQIAHCPFCQSDDIQTATDYYTYGAYKCEYVFACCPDCGARGPMAKTEDEAIRFWNDRPEAEE